MTSVSIHQFKHWLKFHPNSRIRNVFIILKNIRSAELPTPNYLIVAYTKHTSLW